jgi:ribonuclease P protein component
LGGREAGVRLATLMPRFRRDARIRRRQEFQQAYSRGTRVHGRYVTMFVLRNDRPISRLGIAATKRIGGAVARNRAKRLIREVFRHNNAAPGFDIVVVPKRELLTADVTILETEYRRSLDRVVRGR